MSWPASVTQKDYSKPGCVRRFPQLTQLTQAFEDLPNKIADTMKGKKRC